MDLLQTWLVVGVPMLVLAAGLFVGRTRTRALLGYGVLLVLVIVLALTPGGALSAAGVGTLMALAVASGRGTHTDEQHIEHHQQRERFTTAAADD